MLSLYLLSATELCELLKMDVLIEHFKETKKQEGDISFMQFLFMHYVTDDGNSKDNNRDEQLPFKSQASLMASVSMAVILNKPESLNIEKEVTSTRDFSLYKDPFLLPAVSNTVWNPPRIS